MKITQALKNNLIKYNINLPVDGRSAEYKDIVQKFAVPELYRQYLFNQVKLAKLLIKQQEQRDKKNKPKEPKQPRKPRKPIEKPIRYLGYISATFEYTLKNKKTKTIIEKIPVDITVKPSKIDEALKKLYEEEQDNKTFVANGSVVPSFLKEELISLKYNLNNVKIGRKIGNIRMKDAGAGLLDGYDKQEWDTNTGKCVFDYILFRYGNFFKSLDYEELNYIFKGGINEGNYDLKNEELKTKKLNDLQNIITKKYNSEKVLTNAHDIEEKNILNKYNNLINILINDYKNKLSSITITPIIKNNNTELNKKYRVDIDLIDKQFKNDKIILNKKYHEDGLTMEDFRYEYDIIQNKYNNNKFPIINKYKNDYNLLNILNEDDQEKNILDNKYSKDLKELRDKKEYELKNIKKDFIYTSTMEAINKEYIKDTDLINKQFIADYEDLKELEQNINIDLLTEGVSSQEIKRFCIRLNLPMYAIDDNEKCFIQYSPEKRNKHAPAMIYRLSNKHFYPISNKAKIQSITKNNNMIKNIDTCIIKNIITIKEEKNMDNIEYTDDVDNKLLETLNNKKIPSKIRLINNKIIGFSYQDKTYLSNENIDIFKQLCENMDIPYTGQTMNDLLKIFIKEATGNEDIHKSTHNPHVYDTLIKAKKKRTRHGILENQDITDPNLSAVDISKCYSKCLYDPTEEWINTDFNDTWEDYDGKIKLGLYFITTEDITLFKKSGYYSTAIIKKAITEKINFTIIKQLIAKSSRCKNYFKNIINVILKYSLDDTKISKLFINCISGMMGKNEKYNTNVKISNDTEQIFNFLNTYYHLENGIMMDKIEDTEYFIYGFNKKININETNIPIYIQILDESNIRLYDMIKSVGGEVVGLKVDCAIIKNINNTSYDSKEWGGYRMCDVPSLKNTESYENITFTTDGEWIDYDYEDSDEWCEIMKIATEKKGLLLQASAGNGKTYTAKNIAKHLKEHGEGVKILAPTNKAALNIGGSTIHSFLKLSNGTMNKKYIETIKNAYKYIIIDEISMITKELWKILTILKKETDITFILLGDEKQCPPVEDEKIKDYFNHPAVKYLSNNNRNILNVRKRYDETLYNLLKDVNNIKTKEFPQLESQRNICYLNKTRIKINHLWNDRLKNENDLFISADPEDELTQDIYLYLEMPIIAKKTRREGGEILVANSETFNIGNIDETTISLYTQRPDANGEKYLYIYECLIEDFNKYFLLNYCSTTHKAQGETITENYNIYDWSFMCEKIKYTAMSRAKNSKQISFKL